MKRFLFFLTIFIFTSLVVTSSAWGSYTSHSKNGNWHYYDEVDDFSYVYCDLELPVNSAERDNGSLTEVTITAQCTSVGYSEDWTLRVYGAGRWKGVSGSIPSGNYVASISGHGRNDVVTATISIPNQGYNGLGFYHSGEDDDEYYDITVTHIKYRQYTVDGFESTITYDRHVLLSVIQDTPVNGMRYVITRSPKDYNKSRNKYYNGNKDDNVDPEKYYHYSLYYGFQMDNPAGPPITKSVKIPSDATDAKNEAVAAKLKAQDAKLAADAARDAANAAKFSASAAHTDAEKAANRTIYSGKSAARWGHDSYNKASDAAGDATYIRRQQN